MHVQDGVALGKTIKTKLVTLCWKGDEEDPSIVRLPVPYQLPPQPYGTQG